MPRAIDNVRYAAAQLTKAREAVDGWEKELQIAVAAVIVEHPGGLRAWAREMGITPGYAHDLNWLRRKVSPAIVEKLLANWQPFTATSAQRSGKDEEA